MNANSNTCKAVLVAGVAGVLILVFQIITVLYMHKKFDDNITILQSSENTVDMRVKSIESRLIKMHDAGALDNKAPQSSANKQSMNSLR